MKIKHKYTLYNKNHPYGIEKVVVSVGELCKKPDYLHGCENCIFLYDGQKNIHIIETRGIIEINGRPFTPCCNNCISCYVEYGYTLCKKHEEAEEEPDTQRCDDYMLDLSALY